MILGQPPGGYRNFTEKCGDFLKDPVFLSVITPTYNRGQLLKRCYESLLRQTDRDFHWVIVDDGSTDGTKQIVETFADLPVEYIRKENGGKHTALNAAHPFLRGRYVLILDSDDYLTPTAVEQIRRGWARWEAQENVGMLVFLRGNEAGVPMCTGAAAGKPVDILRSKRHVFRGPDCCEVIRTELFLRYPFPVFAGENYVAECALWNRVARTHQCVYLNDVIYICEYLEDGLTGAGRRLRIRSPRGGMFICDLRMQRKNRFLQRLKYGLLYCCYGFFAGMRAGEILKNTGYPVLTGTALLPGWCLYRYWNHRYGD